MRTDAPITRFSAVMVQARSNEKKLPFSLPIFTTEERDGIERDFLDDGARIFNTDSKLPETYSNVDGWISDDGVKQDFEDEYEDRVIEFTFRNFRPENAEGIREVEAAGVSSVTFSRSGNRVDVSFTIMRFARITNEPDELNEREIVSFDLVSDVTIPEQFRPMDDVIFRNQVQLVRNGVEDVDDAFTGTLTVTKEGALLIRSNMGFRGIVFMSGFCAFDVSWNVPDPE